LDSDQDHDLAGLLADGQKGDHAAYEKFLLEASVVLRRFLRRRMNDPEKAEDVLQDTLLSIHRAKNPSSSDTPVFLRGFSWIVNPFEDNGVVIAIEIQSGAAVAGPFKIDKKQLEDMISRAIAQAPASSATSIH